MTKQININGKEIVLADLPEDAINIELHEDGRFYLTYHTGMGTDNYDILRISLPYSGNWRILGSGKADSIPQEEIEPLFPDTMHITYKDALYSMIYNLSFKPESTVILVKE